MDDNRLHSDEDREDREDALPKWAQLKLDLYRRRLTDERKINAELSGDVEESDTLIRWHGIRADHLLPRRAEITFLPDLTRPDHAIDCTMRDGVLRVHGSRTLVIKPSVTNALTIELEK
jgi:hypothetical protein